MMPDIQTPAQPPMPEGAQSGEPDMKEMLKKALLKIKDTAAQAGVDFNALVDEITEGESMDSEESPLPPSPSPAAML